MRLALACLLAALLVPAARARAQDAAPAPKEGKEPAQWNAPSAAPIPPDDALEDGNALRRKALFDLGFNALIDGNLPLAERAFSEAAALPGDPAQSGVAGLFAERVQNLRVRRRVDAGVATTRRPPPRVNSAVGRTERVAIMGATTSLGLGLYGWTLPGALGVDAQQSTRGFVGLYMVTAASSFIVPYLVLRDQPVTAGQANLSFYGGTRGIWHGVLVGSLIAGEIGPNRRSQGWKASMLLGSVGEMMGGYQLSRALQLSAGEARTMAALGDFGLAFGFGTGFLANLNGEPRNCFQFSDPPPGCFGPDPEVDSHSRKMAAAGLVGSGLGLAGGYFLARRRDNSWGDGEVLRASMALGTWTAAGIADLTDRNRDFTDFNNRKYTAALMAGGTVGLVLGDRLVRKTNFSPGQSMLVDLSALSGGLLGAGVTYLAPGDDSRKPYVFASALGSLAGFALAYWGFHDAPESQASRGMSRLATSGVSVIPTAGAGGEHGVALAGAF
jgi:uncharacterized membrane protein YeaQ/YmgE (transglycosylase-associated protein family)